MPFTPTRRRVIEAAATLTAASVLPISATAQSANPVASALAPATGFLDHTRRFLATLDPSQRKSATFPWGGQQWRAWNYFGSTGNIKPGLRLEQMQAAQKDAAWDLAGAVLAPAGITKARNVMTLQDVLAEHGNDAANRSSQRFSFAVFGEPADKGAWGFRLEGHHLTLSVAVRDNQIVSVTPSSFSSNPNRVTSGRHAGLVTLQAEERLARRLFADLPPKLAARARLSARPLDNILSDAGSERTNRKKAGAPASDLTTAQRDLLWQLVETYTVSHLTPTLAETQKARIRMGDPASVHFAWYGPNTAETAFGYRVIGDKFVIELGSVDPAAQHLHTIYNDLDNVLGRIA